MKANIHVQQWVGKKPPKKILVMRFQALGDVIITLPYLQSLKTQFPETEIHFFTRREVSHIPKHIKLFDRIVVLGGGRNAKIQFVLALFKLPALLLERYDAVLDLQNNKISKIIRKVLRPVSWTEFDTGSPVSAGERTRHAIEALWHWNIFLDCNIPGRGIQNIQELLERNGYQYGHELVILNPAGYCASRNWPLQHFVDFAHAWLRKINPKTQFILLLLPVYQLKANYLKEKIGDFCIDLTGKANQVEAFEIIRKASMMVTEDSGLMHMAWVQKIPTIALFSSSRKDWSGPLGDWSACLDSADLPCGPCDLTVCMFNDNRCLVRYSADFVVEYANRLHSTH